MGVVGDAVAGYALAHTTPLPGTLDAVATATRRDTPSPGMMSGLVEARVLEMLVACTDARNVLEVGTFTGFGALAMAAALSPGGRVTTIEYNGDAAALARANIDASPYADRIDLITGDAREAIADLPGPFDIVYLDAWKRDYVHYYEAVLPKLSSRGVIVADNVLWGGTVVEPAPGDDEARAVAAFNDHVQADERTINTVLSVGDGLLVAFRDQSYGKPA
jgi:caffeoyl-CoA O-methyltransferase